jgi:hypothetical protein
MAVNIGDTLDTLDNWETRIKQNKVTNFAYTQEAYNNINYVDGTDEYDVRAENNIPTSDIDVIKVNETIVSKGFRSKASSLTRMLMNHMFGRVSYNLNKIHDNFQTLLTVLKQGFHPVYIAVDNGETPQNNQNFTYTIVCPNFVLEEGARLFVTFLKTKEKDDTSIIRLNVNNTGAKPIEYCSATVDNVNIWVKYQTVEFVYVGTYWRMVGSRLFASFSGGVLYLEVDDVGI